MRVPPTEPAKKETRNQKNNVCVFRIQSGTWIFCRDVKVGANLLKHKKKQTMCGVGTMKQKDPKEITLVNDLDLFIDVVQERFSERILAHATK